VLLLYEAMNPDIRLSQLNSWLASLASKWSLTLESLAPASSDASFRRYFRVTGTKNAAHQSFIVMDAPPATEDTRPFIAISELFDQAKLNVPLVLEKDIDQGFLLLSDLGNETYLSALNPSSAPKLYEDANSALIQLQLASKPGILPEYSKELLSRELKLFSEWYLNKHLNLELNSKQSSDLDRIFELILENNLSQAQVYVHRDFHSRNLMVTGNNNPGILDFQDAVYGPITYDLASLYRDAYIEWEEPEQMDWLIRYWDKARKAGLPVPLEFGDFYRDFEWMGLQRHLKVLGIFARLYHRDGKDGYLKDIPLVFKYTRKVAQRYIALKPLLRLLDTIEGIDRPDGLTF
jgi:aminoglycoside/choline kinase family phosphotransferase